MNVLTRFNSTYMFQAPDLISFKRQETAFIVLDLFVLATLLLIHTIFASYFGTPPVTLLVVLSAGFLLNIAELIFVRRLSTPLSRRAVLGLTWFSVCAHMLLAFVVASLSFRQDAQYFAIMAVPVFEAAFRFSLSATVAVVLAANALDIFWVWSYFRLHPPVLPSEYAEAGMVSLIYAVVGLLVWFLVNHLRQRENDLARSLAELQEAKGRLLVEEKLAAVGRFSSAIAHEIRNPVAMISSALATAFGSGLNLSERNEMFEIAAKEASRLEKLTADFLTYARPRPPARQRGDVTESVEYVAEVCRPRAAGVSVAIDVEVRDPLNADMDAGQVQQALLNLVMNAVEASPAGGVVKLRGAKEKGSIRIDVENNSGPIPPEVVEFVFEPFFTTKPTGTGLGLAIARSITRAHGGDLTLSDNNATKVRFSMTLPRTETRS